MKKILLYLLLTGLTFNYAFAQKDADAKKILNTVSKKYRSYDVIKTDFTFTYENQQAGTPETPFRRQVGRFQYLDRVEEIRGIVLPIFRSIVDIQSPMLWPR